MSSDYRPRSGGGRRRRGGRGRGGQGNYGENRPHTNGSGSSAPKKKGFLDTLLGWFSAKPGKTAGAPGPARTGGPRPDFKSRAPQAERPRREDRPRPEPVPQEIVSPKLYVGNLSYEALESDLFDLFSKVGEVKNVEIAMDRRTNRSKGFGFVEMQTLETAKDAAAKLNRTDFMGRQIVVSGAKLDKRPSESPREADASESESNPGSTI